MKIVQILSAMTDHRSGEHQIFGLDSRGDLRILEKVWVDNSRPDTTDGTKTDAQYKYKWSKCLIVEEEA